MQTIVIAAKPKLSSIAPKVLAHVQQDFLWMQMVTVSAAVILVLLVLEELLISAQDANRTLSSIMVLVSAIMDFTWMETEIAKAVTTLAQLAHLVSTPDVQLVNLMQPSAMVNVFVTLDSPWMEMVIVFPSTATKHVMDAQALTQITAWHVSPTLP